MAGLMAVCACGRHGQRTAADQRDQRYDPAFHDGPLFRCDECGPARPRRSRQAIGPARRLAAVRRPGGTMAEYDLVIRNTTIATAVRRREGRYRHHRRPGRGAGRAAGQGPEGDRRDRPDRRAGRHRRPCPFRPGHRRRLGVLRRFRERQPGGGGRRHHHHHPLRLPEQGPAAARRGQPLPQARRGQVADRLRLPRDPVRSQREDHGPGFPRAGRRRLHLVQGLHDLRRREAHRPRDARCAGRRAARAGDADDPCREFRLHHLADRAAGAGRA